MEFKSGEKVRVIETNEIVTVEYQDHLTKEVMLKGNVALFYQEVEKLGNGITSEQVKRIKDSLIK